MANHDTPTLSLSEDTKMALMCDRWAVHEEGLLELLEYIKGDGHPGSMARALRAGSYLGNVYGLEEVEKLAGLITGFAEMFHGRGWQK